MNSVPDDLDGRDVLVLDPMLATGGSLAFACAQLAARNPGTIPAVCILAPPEGVERLAGTGLVNRLRPASSGDHLDDDAFIRARLGSAGGPTANASRGEREGQYVE